MAARCAVAQLCGWSAPLLPAPRPPLLPCREAWLQPAHVVPPSARREHGRRPAAAAAAAGRQPGAEAAAGECPYALLGLPRTAGPEEVRSAYRRLARQWHPDVNPSPSAADRFKAITRAFEVLSDARARRHYDSARHGRPQPAAGSARDQPPADVHAVLQLNFLDAALGARRSVTVDVMDACLHCGGSGAQPGSCPPPCTMCKGRREIVRRRRGAQRASPAADSVVCCPICAGCGFQVADKCCCCGGVGLTRQPRHVPVQVPAGIDDGSTLRLAAEGDVRRVGGPRGAVVLELRVSPHESMWRQGLDLHSHLAVPLWDALLGGTATVSTLRGAARLDIPPGTQHDAVLSLPRAGVAREGGGSGAHHFRVQVQLPCQVGSDEQALLQRLGDLQRRRRRRGNDGCGG